MTNVSDRCGAKHPHLPAVMNCTLTMWHDGWYHQNETMSWGINRADRFGHLGTDQLRYMAATLEKARESAATEQRRHVNHKLDRVRQALEGR